MDKETKVLLGKLLGEIYRIQKRMPDLDCGASEDKIYGLLNGFESEIDDEIKSIGFVSKDDVAKVASVLDEYHHNPEKLEQLTGFYDIERKLERLGINRAKAKTILTWFNAGDRYTNVIQKMNSTNSPVECKTFEVSEWYK